MSTSRSSRHKSKAPKDPEWSDWEWDGQGYQWYRYRVNSKGKTVYDTKPPDNEASPGSEIDSPAVNSFVPTTSVNADPRSYTSEEYNYQASGQDSGSINALADNLATTSISTQDSSLPTDPYPPEDNQFNSNDGTLSGATAEDRSTEPIPIASRSGGISPTILEDEFSTSTAIGNHMAAYQNRTGTMASSYNPSGPKTFYQSSQRQFGSNFGSSSAAMSSSYSSITTVKENTSGFISSQLATQLTNEEQASGSSGAITPEDTHRHITGSGRGTKEKLDPRFKIHKSKEFLPGHVFKVLWSEPFGYTGRSNATDVTEFTLDVQNVKHGGKVYSSIRRFVIIGTNTGHSSCHPILTYHRQGTMKGGVDRADHAIIYTGSHPPELVEGEPPLLLRPVRVIPKTPRDKLEKESRINYAKIYTVEHNVKVHFIGRIDDTDQHKFVADSDAAWNRKRLLPAAQQGYTTTNNNQQYAPQENYKLQNFATTQQSSFQPGWTQPRTTGTGGYLPNQVTFAPEYTPEAKVGSVGNVQYTPSSNSIPPGSSTDNQYQYSDYSGQQ